MLKLLAITLSRSSTLLSGDNHNILPEVLERLLPLLAIPSLASLHSEAGAVICRILSLLHTASPGLLEALARGTATLFEGRFGLGRLACCESHSGCTVGTPAAASGLGCQRAAPNTPCTPLGLPSVATCRLFWPASRRSSSVSLLVAACTDAYDVAGVLSTQPGLSASVACYAGALRSTDSAEPPLQLRLDSPAACECLLAGALRMLAHCLRLRPLHLGASLLTPPVLDRCTSLLLSSSRQLQAAGMRFLAAALLAAPLVPCSRAQLLDTISLLLQQHSAAAAEQAAYRPAATNEQQEQPAADAEEWWQALVLLLRVMQDGATADPPSTSQLLPRTFNLAATTAHAAAAPAGGASEASQLALCQLCRDAMLVQPSLLEGSTQLLQLFAGGSGPCRQLLLQCLALYLERQQQLCGDDAVRAALVQALEGTGVTVQVRWALEGLHYTADVGMRWDAVQMFVTMQVVVPGSSFPWSLGTHFFCELQAVPAAEDDEGSARKRRRLRATPSRPASPPQQAQKVLLPPPPSLSAVAAAVARLAADLQDQCRQQSRPDSADAFAALLGLLAPLAPRPAVAMATAVLTAALEAASSSGSRRQSVNVPPEQLGALLQLALAALQAGLVESAASKGEVDASTSLSKLRGYESQLHSVLQRAWHSGSGNAAAGAAAAAAEDSQAMSLICGLAAVQAQLLHPEDLLKLLQQALQQQDVNADGSGGSSGASSVAAAAAVLLPAAACIAAHTRDNKDSAPQATQGGRRSRQPTPNPVVTELHQLVGSAGQQPAAVLTAVAQGLLCAVRHSREALHLETPVLALAAIDAALNGGGSRGSGAFGLSQLLHALEAGSGDGPPAEFRPSLSAAMSEWVRPALEHLAAAQLPVEAQVSLAVCGCLWIGRAEHFMLQSKAPELSPSWHCYLFFCPPARHVAGTQWHHLEPLHLVPWQVALVDATAIFLQRGAQGQLEHARPLVQWLVQAAASPAAPVRAAVLRHAALFGEPQVRWAVVAGPRGGYASMLLQPTCSVHTFVACPPLLSCCPAASPKSSWRCATKKPQRPTQTTCSLNVHSLFHCLPSGHPGTVPRGRAPHPHQGPGGGGGGAGGPGQLFLFQMHTVVHFSLCSVRTGGGGGGGGPGVARCMLSCCVLLTECHAELCWPV